MWSIPLNVLSFIEEKTFVFGVPSSPEFEFELANWRFNRIFDGVCSVVARTPSDSGDIAVVILLVVVKADERSSKTLSNFGALSAFGSLSLSSSISIMSKWKSLGSGCE